VHSVYRKITKTHAHVTSEHAHVTTAHDRALHSGCVPLNVRNARVHHFILVWHSITTKMKWSTRALNGTHPQSIWHIS